MTVSPRKLARALAAVEQRIAKARVREEARREKRREFQAALRAAVKAKGLTMRSPVKAKRSTPRKGRQSDPRYLAWVRQQPCILFKEWPEYLPYGGLPWAAQCHGMVEAHHVKTKGAGGSDHQTVPLCRNHHLDFHAMGRYSFAASFCVDLAREAEALYATYQREHPE